MVWKYEQRVQSSLGHGLLSNNTKRHHFNLTMRLSESGRGLQDGVKGHGWNEKIGKMEPHQALSPLALCAAGSRGQKRGLRWGRGVRVATGLHPWAPPQSRVGATTKKTSLSRQESVASAILAVVFSLF